MDHCLRHVPDTCVEISLHGLGQSVHGFFVGFRLL
jgi:hypothetical protein